ncbi:uncharacterized protein ACN2A1_008223 [Glossina fuscipes fuscipes]|uniref:Uncharacterized protein n=1 Tax=Glossina palpalis gambiensis TaxID=67801 RepID=A0A1B0BNS9_9MUSC
MASYKLCIIIVILYVLTMAQSGAMAPKKLRGQVKKSNGNVKLKATFKIAPGPSKLNKRNAKMGFYNGLSATSPIGGFYSGPPAHMFLHSSPLTTTYYPMRWSSMMPGNILRRTDEFSPLPSAPTLIDNMNSFGSSSSLMDNILPSTGGSLWSSNDLPLVSMKSMPGNGKLNFLNSYNLNEPSREYNNPFGGPFNHYI